VPSPPGSRRTGEPSPPAPLSRARDEGEPDRELTECSGAGGAGLDVEGYAGVAMKSQHIIRKIRQVTPGLPLSRARERGAGGEG